MVYKATCKLSSSALTAPSKAQTATHGNVIGRMGQNALRVCNAADNGLGRTTKSASIVLTAPLKAQTAIHGSVTGRMGKNAMHVCNAADNGLARTTNLRESREHFMKYVSRRLMLSMA